MTEWLGGNTKPGFTGFLLRFVACVLFAEDESGRAKNCAKSKNNSLFCLIPILFLKKDKALLKNKLNISRKSIPIIRCLSRISVQVIS